MVVYKGGGIFIYAEDAHQPALTSVGVDMQILDITDAAVRSLLERIPDRHLAHLDEDEREQLLVDLQDALTNVLKRTLGKAAVDPAD